MRKTIMAGGLVAGFVLAIASASAGFDTVEYPEGYRTKFVHYDSKDDAEKYAVYEQSTVRL